MRNGAVMLTIVFLCSPALAQESIDIDESTVHFDFNFKDCRRQAKTLDQNLECLARKDIWDKKFYSDGTLVSDDPHRAERKLQDRKDAEFIQKGITTSTCAAAKTNGVSTC